ncbi:unnamed protein product, partial [Rotaria sp. Silwood2]
LECILILPEKFRTHIEGLVGNFNGDSNDDLFNRETNQIVPIENTSNLPASEHDKAVLEACLSWKVPNDITLDNRKPIMPRSLVEWYYKNASNFLIINSFISQATASKVRIIQESRTALAERSPTIDSILPVKITLPIDNTNRNYSFEINIIASDRTPIRSTHVTIYPFNTTQNINNNGILCELVYDGCTSGSACKVNWDNETTCIKLNATDQLAQNGSYYCKGNVYGWI